MLSFFKSLKPKLNYILFEDAVICGKTIKKLRKLHIQLGECHGMTGGGRDLRRVLETLTFLGVILSWVVGLLYSF